MKVATNKAVFITGTDTGVGKTIIAGLLGCYLNQRGFKAITQKWVQTGSGNGAGDIDSHLKLMQIRKSDLKDYLSHISPYVFKFPASPHLSARLEGKVVNPSKIKKSFKALFQNFDFVIVEGIGGALVPVNRQKLVIDVAGDLKLPVIVVAGNKLGAINHTLLTLEALQKRKMNIIGVIFNNISKNANRAILEDNPKIAAAFSRQNMLGVLPYSRSGAVLYENFIPIAAKIYDYLANG